MGTAQTVPIAMTDDLSFTIVDTIGNTLHFDRFTYERSVEAARGEYFDANWVRCRITMQTRIEPINQNATFKQSVNAQFLTTELIELSGLLSAILTAPVGAQQSFEPMEPYVEMQVTKFEKIVLLTARMDLAPAVGPVIEFDYECRPEEISATIASIEQIKNAFPERKVS